MSDRERLLREVASWGAAAPVGSEGAGRALAIDLQNSSNGRADPSTVPPRVPSSLTPGTPGPGVGPGGAKAGSLGLTNGKSRGPPPLALRASWFERTIQLLDLHSVFCADRYNGNPIAILGIPLSGSSVIALMLQSGLAVWLNVSVAAALWGRGVGEAALSGSGSSLADFLSLT